MTTLLDDAAKTIALLDKHADRAVEYLRLDGTPCDDDTRTCIWNQMSALLSEAFAASPEVKPTGEGPRPHKDEDGWTCERCGYSGWTARPGYYQSCTPATCAAPRPAEEAIRRIEEKCKVAVAELHYGPAEEAPISGQFSAPPMPAEEACPECGGAGHQPACPVPCRVCGGSGRKGDSRG